MHDDRPLASELHCEQSAIIRQSVCPLLLPAPSASCPITIGHGYRARATASTLCNVSAYAFSRHTLSSLTVQTRHGQSNQLFGLHDADRRNVPDACALQPPRPA